ncbi:MAG: DUF1150 family protein [Pseudomonadota bacterium]
MNSQIVYIREADTESLPEQLRGNEKKVFALHDARSGEQLALAPDRSLAFALALKNDLTPISVH